MLADKDLVYDFFETFARFECAMKLEARFCSRSGKRAIPNWKQLKTEFGPRLTDPNNSKLEEAINYLLGQPPKLEIYRAGRGNFEHTNLSAGSRGEQALEASQRVRNNLFHGGKHTGLPVEEERNDRLLRYALLVIEETSKIDPQFHMTFKGLV